MACSAIIPAMPQPTARAVTETTDETPGQPAATPPGELPPGFRQQNPLLALAGAIKQTASEVVLAVQSMTERVMAELENHRRPCALCVLAKSKWDVVNADAVAFARQQHTAAMNALLVAQATASGIPAGGELTPEQQARMGQIIAGLGDGEATPGVLDFLPEEVRPHPEDAIGLGGHMPQIQMAVCQVGGTDICPWHIQESAQEQLAAEQAAGAATPRQPILVPGPGMSLSTAVAIARKGNLNMPGMPG